MEIYKGFVCGMRHPTKGPSEDDLSRLTNGSSSSSSPSSSGSTTPSHDHANNHGNKIAIPSKFCSPTNSNNATVDSIAESTLTKTSCSGKVKNIDGTSKNSPINSSSDFVNNIKNNKASITFNSSYLPEIIDPEEWQKPRKRKERLDSTSSITQDRKLIRSNSEETLPPPSSAGTNDDSEVLEKVDNVNVFVLDSIRRVSSEDFKKSPNYEDVPTEHSEKSYVSDENDSLLANRQFNEMHIIPDGKDGGRKARLESSPARSHRLSPHREFRIKYCDEADIEHERRRSSERFCKSRAPPGRKSCVMKKSGKFMPIRMRGDEHVYKYDLPTMKYERRGFVSKIKAEERFQRKGEATDGLRNENNDNNLIDFHVIRGEYSSNTTTSPPQQQQLSQHPQQQELSNTTPKTAEALPWDCSFPEDQTPVLSRKFVAARNTDSIDMAAKLSKIMPYPQQLHKQQNPIIADEVMDGVNPYRAFMNLENVKTRDVMQQVIPAMMSFQTPEERLKQINKRLVSLKKKATQMEEAFEKQNGHRPSQSEKINAKHFKNILAEISKLKKEKYELKCDPNTVLRHKISGGMDAAKKMERMRATLDEIEHSLAEKRHDSNRSETLDELTAAELVQEKDAVRHSLLYFESLYGRPFIREERDTARPLYERYRSLKRMVSRATTSCSISGVQELPTIHEHEAMVFDSTPQLQSCNSTDSTTSPSESSLVTLTDGHTTSLKESKLDEDLQKTRKQQQESSFLGEGVHTLSLDKLWEHFDKAREEKRVLKRTIREYEIVFEEQNGRKMLKTDRKSIEETYAQYKEKKAKVRLLQALIKKQISR